MKATAEIREGFLRYFEEKGHVRLPSAPLIPPPDDPTTLLISAGMQPLKPYFLGVKDPPATLLTTYQKCFRATDIEEVGLDGYHLSFFEMMGNFSIGEYFKEGAVELAWEFMFERLEIDRDRLWVSVFGGDAVLGLGEDEVAIEAWVKVGMPRERIVGLPRSENFWQAGETGPCGPCSEMYYDRGEELSCGRPTCGPGCPCERYLEFWNLVFMEFDLHEDGKLTPLPKPVIDTGLGLERTASIQQAVISVYETDGYQKIMDWIEVESGVGWQSSEKATKAHRIIADHGRGMTFLVADGVTPSNEGRGYVLRRVIRRAVQQARAIGLGDLWRIAAVVIEQMTQWYPELEENRVQIEQTVRAEEERFNQTLERGMRLFEEIAERGGDISGEDAFRLHDTYGFPLELTIELAHERGLGVNAEEFTKLMEEQRTRSRAGAGRAEVEAAEFARSAGFETAFVGYEKTDVLTQIGALEPLEGGLFLAKLRESPFYPDGGGQVTDQGYLENEETGARARLHEAHRIGDDQVLVFEGEGFAAGDRVRAVVLWSARFPTMANHTATHLLHAALREVLGDHVRQAGSAVRPDKLRFDFTHERALTDEERERVEEIVNEKVFENHPVHVFETPLEEARNLGAMMLFGEKYGEDVRVVEVPGFSRELCGGTHVRSTAEIGPFVLVSESSVGSGARRIEALTAGEAYTWLRERGRELDDVRRELERARKEAKAPKTAAAGADVSYRDETDGIVTAEVTAVKGAQLRDLSDQIRQQKRAQAVLLGSVDDGRAYLVVNLDKSLVDRGLDAVPVAREAGKKIGGGGGGRPNLGEAGGKNPAGLEEAYQVARSQLVSALT
ncbi:MAG TPA: alanine--tRNA ligase [Gaiellaceae bacterium]|nr:alanine--tRNA ligase [Gaiellaceae bacterium]